MISANPELLAAAARLFNSAAGKVADPTAFLEAPGTIAFAALAGADIVGWCWGYALPRPDGTSMLYLHHLEVAERHRRRGAGRSLLRAFRKAGADRGATTMFLVTGEANIPARRLYESMGATPATQGPTVNYWFAL